MMKILLKKNISVHLNRIVKVFLELKFMMIFFFYLSFVVIPVFSIGIIIKSVGDIQPGTDFPDNRLDTSKGKNLFDHVKSEFTGADIFMGNFEGTLTTYAQTPKNIKRKLVFAFRSPPSYASILKDLGFDVLNVANNHSMDFYQTGFQDTMNNIKKSGMEYTGEKNQIVYLNRKGKNIAVIGFSYLTYHNSINDIKAVHTLVKKADLNADIIIVTCHAGAEGVNALHVKNQTEFFYKENRGNLVQFAHAAIDAGADLVIGHGPHVPRAFELYRKRLIAYSLGNFMGYRTFGIHGYTGYSLILDTYLDADGKLAGGKIIPVLLKSNGIPYLDKENKIIPLIKSLSKEDFPQSKIKFNDNGFFQPYE